MVLYCCWLTLLPNIFQTLHCKMPDSLVRISVIQQLEGLLHGKLRPLVQQGCHLSHLQIACRKHINRPFSIKWMLLTSIHKQSVPCVTTAGDTATSHLPPFCTAHPALRRHMREENLPYFTKYKTDLHVTQTLS